MSAQKKRNFQIEAFKHRVVVDPKYAEKTWKILEHAIQEIYNHKIGCVLSLSLSLSPWAHCLHCLVSTTCSSGFRVILCLNTGFSSFIGVPRWENESAFCKLKTWRCSGSERRIQKTKSDIIAKADGNFVPRERRKRHKEKYWLDPLARLMKRCLPCNICYQKYFGKKNVNATICCSS